MIKNKYFLGQEVCIIANAEGDIISGAILDGTWPSAVEQLEKALSAANNNKTLLNSGK